ncbi:MAG: TrbI/VirB10 family protein [Proteobacteria bacterium]|nr:TrbI/VirB10 family protein [Pseudomonadota bacterium]
MFFKRGFRFFLLGLSWSCLEGCQEEKNKTILNRLNFNSEISSFLHNLDHISLDSEISSIDDVDSFEETSDMEKENKAAFHALLEAQNHSQKPEKERKSLYLNKVSRERKNSLHQRSGFSFLERENISEEKASLILTDSNYVSRLKGIGEDLSTFPVKGDRVLTADRYIPVILENAINSQLGGRFIVIVERHVFANEGRNILLPKGTRIICSYKSLVKEGDTRLNAVCGRAIRPDGASVLLTDAYAADQMARTGLIGKVDNRIWEKYSSSFIVAGISALAAAGADTSETSLVRQAAGNLSVNLGNITTGLLNSHINLAPIVNVAAGSRLQIIPMTDIWLRSPIENETSISERNSK